jgi:hypothetical protein
VDNSNVQFRLKSDQSVEKQKSYAILKDRLETFDRYCASWIFFQILRKFTLLPLVEKVESLKLKKSAYIKMAAKNLFTGNNSVNI